MEKKALQEEITKLQRALADALETNSQTQSHKVQQFKLFVFT